MDKSPNPLFCWWCAQRNSNSRPPDSQKLMGRSCRTCAKPDVVFSGIISFFYFLLCFCHRRPSFPLPQIQFFCVAFQAVSFTSGVSQRIFFSIFDPDQPISWFKLSMCDSSDVNMVRLDRIDNRIWKFLQKVTPERFEQYTVTKGSFLNILDSRFNNKAKTTT